MAAPNLLGTTTVLGKTTGVALSSTSATSVLSNASSSGKVLKVNTLTVANTTGSAATIIIVYNTGASLGGTSFPIVSGISVPANASITVIDKSSAYYLEENTSLGATAGTSNALTVTVSYEDIS